MKPGAKMSQEHDTPELERRFTGRELGKMKRIATIVALLLAMALPQTAKCG